ncbi:MAG: glycerophosphodiester phosphodiesterase family protein [Alphaproteobacteria bacterium]|nr:glycerophosphodiester phosphodiesterase family protein [Alphaproteobacteria bacterium]
MEFTLPPLIGHRGAARVAPENTLPGLAVAAEAGVCWVELDVKLTVDDVAILMHDNRLDRTTDRRGPVGGTTWAQLAGADAGAWFGGTFAGTPIPRLDTGLATLRRLGLSLNLEIKPCPGRGPATAAVAARTLAAADFPVDQVVVTSFDWSAIAWLAARAPTWPRGLLTARLDAPWARTAAKLGCVSVHVGEPALLRAGIAAIHDAGFLAAAYTVNDVARTRALLAAGIDALITDAPADLRDGLADLPGIA